MDYQYTPFDPVVWSLFAAFVVVTYLIVKIYHRRYPAYPGKAGEDR